MKLCKYCKQPGHFDKFQRKILCDYHRDLHGHIKSLWEAVTDIQMNTMRSRH